MSWKFWKKEVQPEVNHVFYQYEKQVMNGAKWLDKIKPNWYKSIPLDDINLNDYGKCALGCTFGKDISTLLQHDSRFAADHGFMTEYDGSSADGKKAYKVLTGAWVREIMQRRAADRLVKEALRNAPPATEVKEDKKNETL